MKKCTKCFAVFLSGLLLTGCGASFGEEVMPEDAIVVQHCIEK